MAQLGKQIAKKLLFAIKFKCESDTKSGSMALSLGTMRLDSKEAVRRGVVRLQNLLPALVSLGIVFTIFFQPTLVEPANASAADYTWRSAANGSTIISVASGGGLTFRNLDATSEPRLVADVPQEPISSVRWDGKYFVATSFFKIFYSSDGIRWNRLDLPTGDYFDPGKIISDSDFFAASSMSQSEIAEFIDSKVGSCRVGYTCLEDYTERTWNRASTQMCDAYVSSGVESAAKIIKKVATACGISPQVLLVLLQKEQGLVTHTWPSSWRFEKATGYACPDTAPCDAQYYGFYNQVYNAAKQFKRYANPPGTSRFFTWYPVGSSSSVLLHPNVACGRSSLVIRNQATANLYYYTPYVPNKASLLSYSGTGDSCSSYGNRNFWRYFNSWFSDGGDFSNWAITTNGVGVVVDQDGTTLKIDLTNRSWSYTSDLPGGRSKGVQLVGLNSSQMLVAQRFDGRQFSFVNFSGWQERDFEALENPSLENFRSTSVPTVNGLAVVGQTLEVDEGEWVAGDAEVSFSYQWLANGKAIKRATGPTYVPTSKDSGKRISVRVTGSAPSYVTTSEVSTAADAVSR